MTKQDGETKTCTNYVSIMHELAKGVYLQDVLLAKKDTKERAEIEGFVEMTSRVTPKQLIEHLNKHLETKMFLVGQNITAADIVAHLYIAKEFQAFIDAQKKEVPHTFRWVDHIQHLPGMLEQVELNNIFVSFPSEKEEKLSKA